MSIVIRNNLSTFTAQLQQGNTSIPLNNIVVGKVYGVVTTENTPTEKQYKRAKGAIGTIFYKHYNDTSKNIDTGSINDTFLDDCQLATSIFSNINHYPLITELVVLMEGPAPSTQESNSSIKTYYFPPLNAFNNIQQNSLSVNDPGDFIEDENLKPLQPFQGDIIYQGRRGNGIRFGSTVSTYSDLSEWSKGSVSNSKDPIMIIANGYVSANTSSLSPNVEEINKEKSSIYLTSTQTLPLIPGASIVNPRVNTVSPKDYKSSQLIFNSDRITLNSKKDEVLLFAKTNIELNSDNIININAGKVVHLHVNPKDEQSLIALGTKPDGSYPTEPVVLGGQLMYTFDLLLGALSNLASNLTRASTQDGPISGCKDGGTQLFTDIERICDQLEKCISTKVTTI
jgi:hypothetical protein